MIWNQTVFSKKNRSLKTGSQLMDEYHILTSGQNNAAPNRVLRDLRARGRRYHEPLMAFIHRLDEGMFVGLMGKNEAVIGTQHEFAREATVSHFSGPGREIAFNHAYHCPASANPTVPDLVTLCKQQRVDLLHILTEAHAGREPIPMEPVAFASQRIAGTDWDRVAAEVDAGKCQGGFFSTDGKLIERFETISETVTKEAQKKTALDMARKSIPTGEIAKAKGTPFAMIAAVAIGAAITGWAAWTLIQREGKQHQPANEKGRN